MNIELAATWAVLIVSGVIFQIVTAHYYKGKRASQNGAIMSLIFLGASLLVLPFAFEVAAVALLTPYTVYLGINALILYAWKFHPLRTKAQVVRSAFVLSATTTMLVGVYLFLDLIHILCVLYALSIFVSYKITRQLQRAYFRPTTSALKETLTLSVAVPARNETHALTQSLRSLVQAQYDKIEFIVADDCSQDTTSQIIRSFANDGVRFVNGTMPHDSWIGKNQTYKLLAEESSGEYILFSGVDTRYEPHSIRKLIEYMQANKLDMVSVMPRHAELRTFGAILQPFRYIHGLIVSRSSRQMALSTVWVIKKDTLAKLGGFDAVQSNVVPEQYFAAQLSKKNTYQFIIASPSLGISTYKKASSQLDSAVRTMYPRFKKSIANQYLFALSVFVLYVLPFIVLITQNDYSMNVVRLVSVCILLYNFLPYLLLLALSYTKTQLLFSPVSFTLGIVGYVYASFLSMFRYETGNVTWKGRNICEPVMLNSLKRK